MVDGRKASDRDGSSTSGVQLMLPFVANTSRASVDLVREVRVRAMQFIRVDSDNGSCKKVRSYPATGGADEDRQRKNSTTYHKARACGRSPCHNGQRTTSRSMLHINNLMQRFSDQESGLADGREKCCTAQLQLCTIPRLSPDRRCPSTGQRGPPF